LYRLANAHKAVGLLWGKIECPKGCPNRLRELARSRARQPRRDGRLQLRELLDRRKRRPVVAAVMGCELQRSPDANHLREANLCGYESVRKCSSGLAVVEHKRI